MKHRCALRGMTMRNLRRSGVRQYSEVQRALMSPGAFAQVATQAAADDASPLGERSPSLARVLSPTAPHAPTPRHRRFQRKQLQLAAPRNLVDAVLCAPAVTRQHQRAEPGKRMRPKVTARDLPQPRGLGTSRTLVLMDGRRLAPTQNTNAVDAAMIPEALVTPRRHRHRWWRVCRLWF